MQVVIWMTINVEICVCTYISICIHVYIYTYMYINMYVYICIYTHIYIHMYMNICIYIYMYTYTYVYIYIYIWMFFLVFINICIYMYIFLVCLFSRFPLRSRPKMPHALPCILSCWYAIRPLTFRKCGYLFESPIPMPTGNEKPATLPLSLSFSSPTLSPSRLPPPRRWTYRPCMKACDAVESTPPLFSQCPSIVEGLNEFLWVCPPVGLARGRIDVCVRSGDATMGRTREENTKIQTSRRNRSSAGLFFSLHLDRMASISKIWDTREIDSFFRGANSEQWRRWRWKCQKCPVSVPRPAARKACSWSACGLFGWMENAMRTRVHPPNIYTRCGLHIQGDVAASIYKPHHVPHHRV